jgi:hypothetical protein
VTPFLDSDGHILLSAICRLSCASPQGLGLTPMAVVRAFRSPLSRRPSNLCQTPRPPPQVAARLRTALGTPQRWPRRRITHHDSTRRLADYCFFAGVGLPFGACFACGRGLGAGALACGCGLGAGALACGCGLGAGALTCGCGLGAAALACGCGLGAAALACGCGLGPAALACGCGALTCGCGLGAGALTCGCGLGAGALACGCGLGVGALACGVGSGADTGGGFGVDATGGGAFT